MQLMRGEVRLLTVNSLGLSILISLVDVFNITETFALSEAMVLFVLLLMGFEAALA